MIGVQQPLLLQPQRVEDLVVPEHIAPRAVRFLNDRIGQADGLRAFVVVFRQHRDAGRFLEFQQHRLGEFAVECRIDDDRIVIAAAGEQGDEQRNHKQAGHALMFGQDRGACNPGDTY